MPSLKLSLQANFSLISFLLMAAVAIALAWPIQWQLEQRTLLREAESTADQVAAILGPRLHLADLAGPLDPARYAELDTVIRRQLLVGHIVQIKLWAADGLLVYCNDERLVGRRFPRSRELDEALAGKISTGISSLAKEENLGKPARLEQVLKVYAPLRPADSPQVAGAYELYYSLAALGPHIDEMRTSVWGSVALGFLVLYVSLFTLVRSASHELVRQNEENARLHQEAKQRLIERKQAEEQTQRHLHRLAALRTIDMAITGSLDVRLTLSVLLDQVVGHLGVHAAAILLLNRQTQMLEYAAGRGFHTDGISRSRLRLGDGFAGRAALERRIVGVPDLREAGEEHARASLLAGEDFVSYYAVPLIAKGQVQGLMDIFHRAPLAPEPEWLDFLEALAAQAAIAIDNATLFNDLQRSNVELTLAYDATIEGWARALELRDQETEGHARRVADMTLAMARAMGVSEAELVHVRRGALLHDIGKMGIPDSILLKPGPLSDEEWAIMRRHPAYAHQMISPIAHLRQALDIPYCHHEKWDGTGYPRGLKGEEIPLAARIFALVDVWDALRSDRPYRAAWPVEAVREHIRSLAGSHLDPHVVDLFLNKLTEY